MKELFILPVLCCLAFTGLSTDADAQDRVTINLQSRDGSAAIATAVFAPRTERPILNRTAQRAYIGGEVVNDLMPVGQLTNRGRAPVDVVIWMEVADERRGFALFNPRQRATSTGNAIPVAYGRIAPRGSISFSDLEMVGEVDQLLLGNIGNASVLKRGRLIVAATTQGALQVSGHASGAPGALYYQEDEEDLQMMPRSAAGAPVPPLFAVDMFSPGAVFFPTGIIDPPEGLIQGR
jgi:hypothetical protein